ncbi:MAG: VOC family protein [Actinomycetota bacterium]
MEDPEEFEIRPSTERLPGLLFVPVSEPKLNKNRLHLDFRPDNRDAEVERLLGRHRRVSLQGRGVVASSLRGAVGALHGLSRRRGLPRRRPGVRGAL